MTLFEKLQSLNLPVISVSEQNEITMGIMTPDQLELYQDALLEFFYPQQYNTLVQERLERVNFREQLQTVIQTLQTIASAETLSLEQVINAVQYMATIQAKQLKFLAKGVL